jgi:hypothetical protein
MEDTNTSIKNSIQPGNKLKTSLEYGIIIGLVSIVIDLGFYFSSVDYQSGWKTFVGIIAGMALILMILKMYRDGKLGGKMTFSQGLVIGILSYLWAGVLVAIYVYIFIGYVDTGIMETIMDQQYEEMLDSGMPESQIDQALEISNMFMKPWVFALITVFSNGFMGVVYSLIGSAIVKKN